VTDDEVLDSLVARADLDGLVRLVDEHCSHHDWPALLRLRDRSRAATHTGRQLWPAAALAEYRLALLAPAEWAAQVLTEDAGRFAIGPLTEVVAQAHPWDSLAPHLAPTPRAAFVAHERVLRGEDLRAAAREAGLPAVLDLPLVRQGWEPAYALAEYRSDGASFDPPPLPARGELAPLPAADRSPQGADDAVHALRELVSPWTAGSNGRVDVASVEGDHRAALAALGLRSVRMAEIDAGVALAHLAWAGASGGAFGRRRGAAAGRFGAWWTVTALGGLTDEWPLPADDVGALAHDLRWFSWDAGEPESGWRLQLAVWDPVDDLSWAVSARDDA
jgi:hypothetical protein